MSESEPVIAQKTPYPVEVEEGKKYFWCACGKSARQPFCDGSHEGTDFTPMSYAAPASKTLYFCGCKQTAGAPLCDGAHNALE
ncbi:MAG: CDGSH iron-sulfur domain-containing protein [Pseudomonadota bacterium]